MTDELPNALEMLKLDRDKFMEHVSRAISEKPWRHYKHILQDESLWCPQCNSQWSTLLEWKEAMNSEECPVPPKLTDPPEVIAFRLRDKVAVAPAPVRATSLPMAIDAVSGRYWTRDDDRKSWWIWTTPYAQITVCLVALGKWRIGDK